MTKLHKKHVDRNGVARYLCNLPLDPKNDLFASKDSDVDCENCLKILVTYNYVIKLVGKTGKYDCDSCGDGENLVAGYSCFHCGRTNEE